MKSNNSSKKFLIIVSSVFILGTILFFSSCFLILGFKNFLSRSSGEAVTHAPTITPVPLPATIEDVKSNCSNGECLNACLAHANIELQRGGLDSYQYNGEETNLVYYGISDEDNLEKPRKFNVQAELISYQQNEDAHKIIWEYYKALLSRESRPNLVTFGIYISSTTLGNFNSTATENWITNINILSLEDASTLSSVVVHEYGHYLTLNTTQQVPWSRSNVCHQKPLYGCQTPDSYINLFYLEFWEDIYPEWKKIDWQSKQYEEEIDSFYHKYENRFLNDYAATDPTEDIAESWETFVLKPAPSGNSIAEQKIKFFYKFPELVQLRYQIIRGICTFKQTQ